MSCEPVCVCVSLDLERVVIICLASTHTALVSSPSLAVLHLPTHTYIGAGRRAGGHGRDAARRDGRQPARGASASSSAAPSSSFPIAESGAGCCERHSASSSAAGSTRSTGRSVRCTTARSFSTRSSTPARRRCAGGVCRGDRPRLPAERVRDVARLGAV